MFSFLRTKKFRLLIKNYIHLQLKFTFLKNNFHSESSFDHLTYKIQEYDKLEDHDLTVLSVLVGNCLGDASIAKRGTLRAALSFSFSESNREYAEYLHTFYKTRGYCSPNKIKMLTRTRPNGKLYYDLYFYSYGFKSFALLHRMFYRSANEEECLKGRKFIKIIPKDIKNFLTKQALAIWFMDDGNYHIRAKSITIATHAFKKEEVELLKTVLKQNFDLDFTIQTIKKTKQYYLYLGAQNVPKFRTVVQPFIIPFMLYKLGLDNMGNLPSKPLKNIVNRINELTPITFATWFIKNGSFNKRDKCVILGSDGCSQEETLKLQTLLKEKFNLFFTIHGQFRLYLPRKQVPLLIRILKEHLNPKFWYKLGL